MVFFMGTKYMFLFERCSLFFGFLFADFQSTKDLWQILHLSVLRGQHPENLNDLAWRNEDLEAVFDGRNPAKSVEGKVGYPIF